MKIHITIQPRFRLRPLAVILLALAGIAFVIAIIRYANGIGAISNLSNSYPWGFWVSFDLVVTRFSGRRAPERNDPDPVLRKIMQEAYSHEVISAGWWPGGGEIKEAAFYCYAAPPAPGFAEQKVRPDGAFYHSGMGEYLMMYDQVRNAPSPSAALLDFLESTYAVGATTGKWDRAALEAK